MTAVLKPIRIRKPRQACPRCRRLFTARALIRHAKGCGQKNKFNAKKTIIDGESFPSKLEARTWLVLKSLEAQGIYEDLQRYDVVELIPGIKWNVDFSAIDRATGKTVWFEAKGIATERYRVLLQIWRNLGPGPLYIYKADSHGNPALNEIVVPRRMK